MEKYEVRSIGKIINNGGETAIKLDEFFIPALQGLEGFSHLIIVWWFSNYDKEELRNVMLMPKPYKNAPESMGIFATRSPIRPNPIALTAAEVINIDYKNGIIHIDYTDADNGSPVLDIKPYTPSIDRIESPSVPDWCGHWPLSREQSADFDWEKEFNF